MVRIISLFLLGCCGCTSVSFLEIPRDASWDTPEASFRLLCWAISHDQPVLVYRSLSPALKVRYEKELGVPVRLDTFLDGWDAFLRPRWKALATASLVATEAREGNSICLFLARSRKGNCRFRNYPYYEIRSSGGEIRDGYLKFFHLETRPGQGWVLADTDPALFPENDPPVRFTAGQCWLLDEEPQWDS